MNLEAGKRSSLLVPQLLSIVILSFNAGAFITSSAQGSAIHDPVARVFFLVGCFSILIAVFLVVAVLRRAS